ncbi:MAG TPA: hypothetical protein DEF45_15800 [Rhodopirellula sp.]|nr:MAG: hypothetical protein CBD74_01450 [Saprospirales bacterium TMED214]HBV64475.1 hypothetical protein [Rhodopirellula sp.]
MLCTWGTYENDSLLRFGHQSSVKIRDYLSANTLSRELNAACDGQSCTFTDVCNDKDVVCELLKVSRV